MKVAKGNAFWASYVDFVNGIVVQGLARLVVVSLRKLVDLLSPEKIRKNQDLPMLIIDCLLTGTPAKVRFQPDVGEDASGSLYDIVDGWVNSFYHCATMFKRLDDAEGRYIREMVDDLEVQMLLATLNETVARAEASAVEFRNKYDAYSYLWTSDSSEAFKAFCDSAYIELPKTEEQLKVEADMEPDEIPPQPRVPDLAKFDAEIARYRDIAEQVSAMKTPTDIGFLRINSQPAKTALLAIVNKWTLLFTLHLQRYVTEQTQEMHTFETGVLDGLEEDASFSKEALKRNMAHIRDGGFRLWCYQSRAYHSLHLSLCSSQNALHSQGQPRATTQGGRFAQEVRHYRGRHEDRFDAHISWRCSSGLSREC